MSAIGENRGPISEMNLFSRVNPPMRVPSGVTASADSFGAGSFNDLYNLGVATQRFSTLLGSRAIDLDHQKQADSATNALMMYERAYNDKKAELLGKKSGNALEVEKELDDWDRNNRLAFEENAKGGIGARLFQQHADKIHTQGLAQMAVHQTNETIARDFELIDGQKQTIVDDTKKNPAAFSQNLDRLRAAIGHEADIKGWSGEERHAKMTTALAAYGRETITAMLQDPAYGYAGVTSFIDSSDGKKLRELLGEATYHSIIGKFKPALSAEDKALAANAAYDEMYAYANDARKAGVSTEETIAGLNGLVMMKGYGSYFNRKDVLNIVQTEVTDSAWVKGLPKKERDEYVKNETERLTYDPDVSILDLDAKAKAESDPVTRQILFAAIEAKKTLQENVQSGVTSDSRKIVQDLVKDDFDGSLEALRQAGSIAEYGSMLKMRLDAAGYGKNFDVMSAYYKHMSDLDFGNAVRKKDLEVKSAELAANNAYENSRNVALNLKRNGIAQQIYDETTAQGMPVDQHQTIMDLRNSGNFREADLLESLVVGMQVDKNKTMENIKAPVSDLAYQDYLVNPQKFLSKLRSPEGSARLIQELGAEKFSTLLKSVDTTQNSFQSGMRDMIDRVNNDLAMRLQITSESSKSEQARFEYVKRTVAADIMNSQKDFMRQYKSFSEIPQETIDMYVKSATQRAWLSYNDPKAETSRLSGHSVIQIVGSGAFFEAYPELENRILQSPVLPTISSQDPVAYAAAKGFYDSLVSIYTESSDAWRGVAEAAGLTEAQIATIAANRPRVHAEYLSLQGSSGDTAQFSSWLKGVSPIPLMGFDENPAYKSLMASGLQQKASDDVGDVELALYNSIPVQTGISYVDPRVPSQVKAFVVENPSAANYEMLYDIEGGGWYFIRPNALSGKSDVYAAFDRLGNRIQKK